MARVPRIRYLGTTTTSVGYDDLVVSVGTLTLTGQSVALKTSRQLVVSVGTLTLSGQSVTLKAERKLTVVYNTLTLSGQSITLTKSTTGTGAILVFDEILIREPNLILPRKVPIGEVQYKKSSRFPKPLSFIRVGYNKDLILGNTGVETTDKLLYGSNDKGLNRYTLTDTNRGLAFTDNKFTFNFVNRSYTAFVHYKYLKNNTSSNNFIFSLGFSLLGYYGLAYGTSKPASTTYKAIYINNSNDGELIYTASDPIQVGKEFVDCVRIYPRDGSTRYFDAFEDGSQIISSYREVANAERDFVKIGEEVDGYYYATLCEWYSLVIFDKYLTNSQIKEFSISPYQILEPK
jgi:hypothetical protein